jgi:hypothetical protein
MHEQLLGLLRVASEHALKSEPGTSRYVLATNRMDANDLGVYVVEVCVSLQSVKERTDG